MITVRRSAERHHVRHRDREVWRTFDPKFGNDPLAGEFEAPIALNESRLPPGSSMPSRPLHDAEVITYVFEGALACDDTTGTEGVTYAGEFQRRARGAGISHRETNPSRSGWARVFQIHLPPSPGGIPPAPEKKRFPSAQRRGLLCFIASPDGRQGSLHLQSSTDVYSSILDSGRHLALEIAPSSGAWLHVVKGEVKMNDLLLSTGDGAGVFKEHSVSLIASSDSEILLLVLARQREAPFSKS